MELKNLEVLDISIHSFKLLDKLEQLPKLKTLYVDSKITDENIKIIKEKHLNLDLEFAFRPPNC